MVTLRGQTQPQTEATIEAATSTTRLLKLFLNMMMAAAPERAVVVLVVVGTVKGTTAPVGKFVPT